MKILREILTELRRITSLLEKIEYHIRTGGKP